jgi:hypothetical protein
LIIVSHFERTETQYTYYTTSYTIRELFEYI